MMQKQTVSFSHVTLTEAIARRSRVTLIVGPSPEGKETRLSSRILGTDAQGDIILATPESGGKKSYLPCPCRVGIILSVQEFSFQAQTELTSHCLFHVHPTRRVDALVLRRPEKVLALGHRQHPRWEAAGQHVSVSAWMADALASKPSDPACRGLLLNWSQGGLGTVVDHSLTADLGKRFVLRMEAAGLPQNRIYWATLKHCTPRMDGTWLVGWGEVDEIGPGQAVAIMESLAAPTTTSPA